MRILWTVTRLTAIPASPPAAGERHETAPSVDWLKAATDFADCMIRHGRDRYGKVHSPLLAKALTQEREPRLVPYPLFADSARIDAKMRTPFSRLD